LHQENCDETAMILSLDSIRNQRAMPMSPSATANAR